MLDSLTATDVGRLVPPVEEDGAGSQMSEWELRERREREEEQEAEVEELGAAARAPGKNYRYSYPRPPSWHRQARSRGTGCAFLCFFPFVKFLGRVYSFLGQAWAEGKEKLATSRHCADCGQENRAKCTPP